jgi:Holliday junction resolvase
MAMTPEAKVKKKVTNILKELNTYYFYPVTGGYGKSGVPDIIGCYEGKFFGIECKAGKNKPTPLQEKNLADIKAAGGIALVVNEDNIEDVRYALTGCCDDPRQLTLNFN